jgi:hypothetical protein
MKKIFFCSTILLITFISCKKSNDHSAINGKWILDSAKILTSENGILNTRSMFYAPVPLNKIEPSESFSSQLFYIDSVSYLNFSGSNMLIGYSVMEKTFSAGTAFQYVPYYDTTRFVYDGTYLITDKILKGNFNNTTDSFQIQHIDERNLVLSEKYFYIWSQYDTIFTQRLLFLSK